MTEYEHSPEILRHADNLVMFQQMGQFVGVRLKDDPDVQAMFMYNGIVDAVALDTAEPYVDLRAQLLFISYLSSEHLQAEQLVRAMHEAREAVSPTMSAAEGLSNDFVLANAVEAQLSVKCQDQTIQLNGISQHIALSNISTVLGIGRISS